jgi:hypothetical protein
VPESILLALEIAAGIAGMSWFALAKGPHWQQVTGAATLSDVTRRNLRVAGATALGAALLLALAADHITMSFLTWFMTLAAASLIVALTLAWRPRTLSVFAGPFRDARPQRRRRTHADLQKLQENDAE